MPRLLAIVLTIFITSTPAARLAAEPVGAKAVCPGIALTLFEHLLPSEVRRYPFEHALLEPFVQLWQSGSRPALPVMPERVTVYAVPDHPLLVGYQSGACVIASLAIDRERLVSWLGPRIGWTI
ncbi:MAG TPA: hypothetical protein VFV80_08505 [Geminicoccaceae bacterium]|nr:hypothetical protein [Geminicoccaceae bacterium]